MCIVVSLIVAMLTVPSQERERADVFGEIQFDSCCQIAIQCGDCYHETAFKYRRAQFLRSGERKH